MIFSNNLIKSYVAKEYLIQVTKFKKYKTPSITDGVHHNENLAEIIPVFSTFSNKKKS